MVRDTRKMVHSDFLTNISSLLGVGWRHITNTQKTRKGRRRKTTDQQKQIVTENDRKINALLPVHFHWRILNMAYWSDALTALFGCDMAGALWNCSCLGAFCEHHTIMLLCCLEYVCKQYTRCKGDQKKSSPCSLIKSARPWSLIKSARPWTLIRSATPWSLIKLASL